MDMKVLQYLMGHKSSKVTNEVYNHITEERVYRGNAVNRKKSTKTGINLYNKIYLTSDAIYNTFYNTLL